MSTSTLGGHVDTLDALPRAGGRRRRLHSDEFKADAVAAALQPGVSMASVALARGINANLLRRWVRDAGMPAVKPIAKSDSPASTFLPIRLPDPVTPAGDIRIEIRRGATTVTVAWPMAAAGECVGWIRDLLR